MSGKETIGSKVDRIESKLDKLVDAFDQRFEAVDQKFEAIDQKFEAIDQKFEAIDQKFEAMDRRFDELEDKMELEFKAVRIEMQCESNRICNRIDGVDSRVHNLEVLAQEKWDVPELRDHMKMVDRVVQKHSDQINVINERLGIVAV